MKNTPSLANPTLLGWLLKAIIYFGVIDTILTVILVYLEIATEANPIMDYLLKKSTIAFVVVKLAVTVAGSLIIWNARGSRLAVAAIYTLASVYGLLVAYELTAIGFIALSK